MQQKRLIGYDPKRPMSPEDFEAYLVQQIEAQANLAEVRAWIEASWGLTFEIRLKPLP